MHENAVDVWTEGLNAGKNSIFKNTSICVDGASTEAKIWCTRLVQVWLSVGDIRDSDEKIYEVCTLNVYQRHTGKA